MSRQVAEECVADEHSERVGAEIQRDFHHPYTPYDIQETFMSTVYQVLDESKVGILESPTGTVCLFSFQFPVTLFVRGRSIGHEV
jgi:hypothetical protein